MKVLEKQKICINCNSTTTNTYKGYSHWYKHEGGYLCKKCYNKLIHSPKWNPILNKKWNKITNKKWNPINNPKTHEKYSPRRLLYKNKSIYIKYNPRQNKCEKCGKQVGDKFINHTGKEDIIKRTNLHHINYHDNDILKDTIELCVSCHTKESYTLKKIAKLSKNDINMVDMLLELTE